MTTSIPQLTKLAAWQALEAHYPKARGTPGSDAAEQIVKLAKHIGAGLIVMTNRGMRGTDPLGSVAEKVLRASKVPVLIVC